MSECMCSKKGATFVFDEDDKLVGEIEFTEERLYYVIYNDGNRSFIDEFVGEELAEALNDQFYGDDVKFLTKPPDGPIDDWDDENTILVIKGGIVQVE